MTQHAVRVCSSRIFAAAGAIALLHLIVPHAAPVVLNAMQALPTPWASRDIGAVGVAGSATFADGIFSVSGAGADIWGTADAFHFMSQPLDGKGDIVARVRTVQNTSSLAKAGVMFRGALTAGSAHVILNVKPAGGVEFMTRSTNGGSTSYVAGVTASLPVWLRLKRDGTTIIGSWSSNGTSWNEVGRTTITLPVTANVGLAVTSRSTSALNTSTFDNVAATPEVPNQPPTVSIATPVQGATFDAPATIAIAASAADADGTVTGVQFFANGVSIGTDTTSPYELTWSSVPAGDYSIVAVATDSANARTSSASTGVVVLASASVSPPSAPSIALPSPGATGVSTITALNWGAVEGATHYDVALGTTESPPLVSTNQTTTSYQPAAALAHSTTYYWRVTAKNAGGETAGALWSFRTSASADTTSTPASTTLRRLRVLTWNVNEGRDLTNAPAVDAQVSLIARSGAHVAVLQDVTITAGADLPAIYQTKLAAATGREWFAVWAEEPRGGAAVPQGNLILSALPLAASETIALEGAPLDPTNVDAQRSAARIAVIVNAITVHIVGTRLANSDESRTAQVRQVQSWMGTLSGPRLIGGSFAMRPSDPGYAEMSTMFSDVWTRLVTTPDTGVTARSFGALAQPARVDGWWQEIATSRAMATEIWITKTARSDHHAVIAEIEVR